MNASTDRMKTELKYRQFETDRELLHNFHTEIGKLQHNFCPKCNERFPSIEFINDK